MHDTSTALGGIDLVQCAVNSRPEICKHQEDSKQKKTADDTVGAQPHKDVPHNRFG